MEALDHGKDAEEWVREKGLGEIDGQPVDPEAEKEEAENNGRFGGLNPFSSG